MIFKLTVCIDFDGVIHSYERGWQEGVIYGTFVPGFMAWAIEASKTFDLVIYSSRSKTLDGIEAMKMWMHKELRERLMPEEASQFIALFTFASEKPAAWITIDDRAITFTGKWDAPELTPDAIMNFKPWNVRK